MSLARGEELLETKVFELDNNVDFLHVAKRCPFELFLPIGNIDKQEWAIREHKSFVLVGHVPTPDPVFIKQQIGNLHQRLVHSILDIQEVEWVTSLDQSRVQ